jgi:hypothetical protein
MKSIIVAHEEPHLTIRLELEPDEGVEQQALARQAIVAIDAVTAGWLEPLAWEMTVGCLDTESMDVPMNRHPSQPYWLLRKEQIPIGIEIRPFHGNHVFVTEPVLSSDPLDTWVAKALAQDCDQAPRFIPCWRRFWSLAMRARLPRTVSNLGHQNLSISCYAGNLAIPLEYTGDDAWVSGRPAGYVMGPPLSLTARNEDGLLVTLDLAVYWSLWIDDPAGRAQVEAAVDRVLALDGGWRRSED